MGLDQLAFGGKGMTVPTLMTEAGQKDLVPVMARIGQHVGENLRHDDHAAARHHIGPRFKIKKRAVDRLMHISRQDAVALAGAFGCGSETGGVVVTEIVEFRMAQHQGLPHLRKLFRIAHRPDLRAGADGRTVEPATRNHGLRRPAGIAHGDDVGSAAGSPEVAALVETDHPVGGVDRGRNPHRHLSVANDHDALSHLSPIVSCRNP